MSNAVNMAATINANKKLRSFCINRIIKRLYHNGHIIIIIDFYGAYILRNLSSEARQNRISKRNRKQGRAKVSVRTRDNRTFMVGKQFGIDMS